MNIPQSIRCQSRIALAAALILVLSLFPSCTSLTTNFNGTSGNEHGTILEFQHAYSKKQSDCLAVCVDMVLNYYGVEISMPDTSLPLDLISLSKSLNTDTPVDEEGHVLFTTVLKLSLDELSAHLVKKRPLIVAFKPSARKEYHSVVLTGYSTELERYYVNDPARRKPAWRKLSKIPTFEDSGKYLVLLIGLCEK